MRNESGTHVPTKKPRISGICGLLWNCGTKNAHIHQLCTGIYMFIRYLYNLTRVALYAKMFHSSTCVSQVPNYLSF